MLNEGVPGKDVSQIAAGFDGLGADFSVYLYRQAPKYRQERAGR